MSREAVWLVIALLVAGLALPLIAGGLVGGWGMGPGMMGGWWAGAGGGWLWALAMLLGLLGMLAFWAAVIVGGVLLLRWVLERATPRPEAPEASALEILKRRYARGEIDQATYERMRRELEQ